METFWKKKIHRLVKEKRITRYMRVNDDIIAI